jgi:hypothetical protein
MMLEIDGDRKVSNPSKEDLRAAVLSLDVEKNGSGFIILSESDAIFIQSSGDQKIGFDLEYQDGTLKKPHRASNENFTADQIVEIFFDYSRGSTGWKKAVSSPVQAGKPPKSRSKSATDFEAAWGGFVFLLAWGGLIGWAGFQGLIKGHIFLNRSLISPEVDPWIYWGIVVGSLLLASASIGLGAWCLAYYYRNQAGTKNGFISIKRRLRLLANILLVGGGMLALMSAADVYSGWRIAANASSYRPTTMHIKNVEYQKGWIVGFGTVDGVREKIALREFAPDATSLQELETAIPHGTVLDVWYDPNAADIMIQGRFLRFLPRSYPLQNAFAVAIKRTLGWDGSMLLGLLLLAVSRKKPQ